VVLEVVVKTVLGVVGDGAVELGGGELDDALAEVAESLEQLVVVATAFR
jgi:hypothetical protein